MRERTTLKVYKPCNTSLATDECLVTRLASIVHDWSVRPHLYKACTSVCTCVCAMYKRLYKSVMYGRLKPAGIVGRSFRGSGGCGGYASSSAGGSGARWLVGSLSRRGLSRVSLHVAQLAHDHARAALGRTPV